MNAKQRAIRHETMAWECSAPRRGEWKRYVDMVKVCPRRYLTMAEMAVVNGYTGHWDVSPDWDVWRDEMEELYGSLGAWVAAFQIGPSWPPKVQDVSKESFYGS